MLGYDWTRLHALLNDLPSALLVAAVFFDLLGTIGRRPAMRQVGFWTLIFGAVGAVLGVLSGLQAEERIAHGGAVHEVMERHEQLAFITLGVFAVLALWRIFRESRMGSGERVASLVVSLVGVGVLIATGKQGGRLVFDHAAGISSEVLQTELRERGAGHSHDGGESHGHEEAGNAHGVPGAAVDSARAGHVDSPGTPPHNHAPRADTGHSHPAGTAPHGH
jgi:uncharacterized membrane protein